MSIYTFSYKGYTYRGTWDEGVDTPASLITHQIICPDGTDLEYLPQGKVFPNLGDLRSFVERLKHSQYEKDSLKN